MKTEQGNWLDEVNASLDRSERMVREMLARVKRENRDREQKRAALVQDREELKRKG